MKPTLIILLAAAAFAAAGCSDSTQPDLYSNQLVVSAFLFAEQPIDSVFLTRTARLTERYEFSRLAITNATVTITLVDTINPANSTVYTLAHDPGHPGRYYNPAVVIPKRLYRISIQAPGYPAVTGTTSVPDTFSVVNRADFPDTLVYNTAAAPYRLKWTKSDNYADYVGSVISTDFTAAMIPNDLRDENDPAPERVMYQFNIPDNSSAEVPWLTFNYYGATTITVSAIDRNYYEFLRQIIVAQGLDLREVKYNLTGALGVFASSARAHNAVHTIVKP